jgi:hypothetical protein
MTKKNRGLELLLLQQRTSIGVDSLMTQGDTVSVQGARSRPPDLPLSSDLSIQC